MRAVNVHLQNCHTPNGIAATPVLAWKYAAQDAGQTQQAYRIVVKDGETLCYDSGMVVSSAQNNIALDMELATHIRYCVRVEIKNQHGQTQWSDPAYFISGVCRHADWTGAWITRPGKKPFYTGTGFEVDTGLASAYLSVCGLGQYALFLNAEKVGGAVLQGSWTDFDKRALYDTHDVTALLQAGRNELAVEVANGWYIADTSEGRHFYTLKSGYHAYGPELPCLLLLTLRYKDGTCRQIYTGSDWWTHPSPTTLANVYGSEDYDARLAVPLLQLAQTARDRAVVLQKSEIPKGMLLPAMHPPVTICRTYRAVSVKPAAGGGLLIDFGQNIAGLFEVTLRGRRGQAVKLSTVEKLDADGAPLPTCNTWSRVTLAGSDAETWRPQFTYLAGRWLHLQACVPGEALPEVLDTAAHAITTSALNTGLFACSDIRLMQVHDLVVKAAEANLNHVHSDCPTMERLGWLETSHLVGEPLQYVKNLETLWDKIAADIRDAQYAPDEYDTDTGAFPHTYGPGLIPSIAPRYARWLWDGGDGSFWDIVPWGSSILLMPLLETAFYGNRRTARDNYETAESYLAYLYGKYERYNEIYGKAGHERFLRHGLGDWGHPVHGDESRENVETAFLYYDYKCLADLAHSLGLKEKAEAHLKRAQTILHAYNHALLRLDEQTGCWYYQRKSSDQPSLSQANQAIPLCFGMVPENRKESVEQSFLRSVENGQLCAGEVGIPYVFETLMRLGRHDLIHAIIMRKEHPSYYRFVEQGETTLPEFWNDNARSRCHDMMGSVLGWFYKGLGGISSDDGYTTITLAPALAPGMHWVHCSYEAITGIVEVKLAQRGPVYSLEVTLPPNTSGTLHIPSGLTLPGAAQRVQRLCAGTHLFTLTVL